MTKAELETFVKTLKIEIIDLQEQIECLFNENRQLRDNKYSIKKLVDSNESLQQSKLIVLKENEDMRKELITARNNEKRIKQNLDKMHEELVVINLMKGKLSDSNEAMSLRNDLYYRTIQNLKQAVKALNDAVQV